MAAPAEWGKSNVVGPSADAPASTKWGSLDVVTDSTARVRVIAERVRRRIGKGSECDMDTLVHGIQRRLEPTTTDEEIELAVAIELMVTLAHEEAR